MNQFIISPKQLLAVLVFICVFKNTTPAQEVVSDYKYNPVWINMIGNPNTNYYEAVKAYETYWKFHDKPNGEEEEMMMSQVSDTPGKMTEKEKRQAEKQKKEHEREMKRESKKKLNENNLKLLEQNREMTYQCKRFEQWLRDVKPFVQNDGRILSQQEQMEIYNKQQEEQRRQK